MRYDRATRQERVDVALECALHEFGYRVRWPAEEATRNGLWRQCAFRAADRYQVRIEEIEAAIEAINTGTRAYPPVH